MRRIEQTTEEMVLGLLAEGGDDFSSGEMLSGKLGLSRSDLWKCVESLREKGYRIDAVPARGYRLVEVPDRLSPLELAPLLNTHDLGRTIHYLEKVGSTNDHASRLAQEGALHGEVVVAETQTAGRGRRGRTWASPSGLNLYFSAIVRPELAPPRAPELTLVTAVALAEALREAGAPAQIKWPNDLMVEGKKIAGILTELSADPDGVQYVIIGVGVNLNATARDFPPDVAEVATSLALVLGEIVPRAPFTAALWTRLEGWMDRHGESGFGVVREAWRAQSGILGQDVLVKTERREFRGRAEDIDDTGALLVRTPEGLERIVAGDVEQIRARNP